MCLIHCQNSSLSLLLCHCDLDVSPCKKNPKFGKKTLAAEAEFERAQARQV